MQGISVIRLNPAVLATSQHVNWVSGREAWEKSSKGFSQGSNNESCMSNCCRHSRTKWPQCATIDEQKMLCVTTWPGRGFVWGWHMKAVYTICQCTFSPISDSTTYTSLVIPQMIWCTGTKTPHSAKGRMLGRSGQSRESWANADARVARSKKGEPHRAGNASMRYSDDKDISK